MEYIISWYLYFIFELLMRAGCLYKIEEPNNKAIGLFSKNINLVEIIIFFVSPGYTLAKHYKKIIRNNNSSNAKLRRSKLSRYIKLNNKVNLMLSLILLNIVLWYPFDENYLVVKKLFSLFVMIRFLSRCFEIIYAFGKDAISKSRLSSLNRNNRLTLALNSYFEIFIISASVYYFYLDHCDSALSAIVASLNIGTLAGAGEYTKYNQVGDITILLPFIQIISTSTLVIFSLAMYASRKK